MVRISEEDGVYYRLGGAALAAMLYLRYDQLMYIIKKESVKVQID